MIDLSQLDTEHQNPNSKNVDELSTLEIVQLVNREDRSVIEAVKASSEDIASAIDCIYQQIKLGGRLIYIGAGTSGRLGVLDASECPPTYGVDENLVIGLIAGGDYALRHAVEGAEDSLTEAQTDLEAIKLNENDVVCGIAASGRTPYVIGGLRYAKSINAKTIAMSCVNQAEISSEADISIESVVGPEIITGSTRMKSGSATKMILNMLSSTVMIKLGKVYGNLMVDVKPSNEKLVERAKSIIMKATNVSRDIASETLELSDMNVKAAIIMIECQVDLKQALNYLEEADGSIRMVVNRHGK